MNLHNFRTAGRPRPPDSRRRPTRVGTAILLAAGLSSMAPAPEATGAVTLVEPGHTATKIADSAFPIHPTQIGLGSNAGANPTGIESIAAVIDTSTGVPRVLVYVQVITPFGSCPSPTTDIFEIDTSAGGLTGLLSAIGGTGFGVCERGSDFEIGFDPLTGLTALLVQDENGASGSFTPEIATMTIPLGFGGGAPGVWSFPASFLNSTFGGQFSNGGAIPAGDMVYVSDNGVLQILSAAPLGAEIARAPLPGPGDDLYVQPWGDIVFVGELGVPIVTYNGGTLTQTVSPLPPYDIIFANAGLMPPVCGSRATVCRNTGEGFITGSCIPGGSGVFRLNKSVTRDTLVLTVNSANEGIQDIFVGPPSSGAGGPSLYLTLENYATGGHEVWEVTEACPPKDLVAKWSQLPAGWPTLGGSGRTLFASTGSAGGAGGPLLAMSTVTGNGVPVTGPLGMWGPVSDVDCDPSGSVIYGVTGGGFGNLLIITPGAVPPEALVGNTGLPVLGGTHSLEWVGNTPYATNSPVAGGPSSLYTVNALNGLFTLVGLNDPGGALGLNPVAALAYDTLNGVMYASETGPGSGFPGPGGRLLTINLATGAATVVAQITDPTGIPFSHVTALEYDPVTDTLYGGTGNNDALAPGALLTINRFTGIAGIVGLSGSPGLSGLTFCAGAPGGFDVESDLDWETLDQQPPGTPGPGPNAVTADDFQSDGRAITCVRWWGSYIDPAFDPVSGVMQIDGWLLSFHTDLPANDPTNPSGFSQPNALLGLYWAPANAVQITPTNLIGLDGHPVYEYVVEIKDCCLLHTFPDPRDNSMPAHDRQFREVAGSIYWLDVQAAVGHAINRVPACPTCTCDIDGDGDCDLTDRAQLAACIGMAGCPDVNCDGVSNALDLLAWDCLAGGQPPGACCAQSGFFCNIVQTNNRAFAPFWGWHTSPQAWNDQSVTGQVVMNAAGGWVYQGWQIVNGSMHGLNVVDQAFELLTPACPADCAPPGGDGQVNVTDLLAVLAKWGQPPLQACDVAPPGGDLVVNVADLLSVLGAWGPCP